MLFNKNKEEKENSNDSFFSFKYLFRKMKTDSAENATMLGNLETIRGEFNYEDESFFVSPVFKNVKGDIRIDLSGEVDIYIPHDENIVYFSDLANGTEIDKYYLQKLIDAVSEAIEEDNRRKELEELKRQEAAEDDDFYDFDDMSHFGSPAVPLSDIPLLDIEDDSEEYTEEDDLDEDQEDFEEEEIVEDKTEFFIRKEDDYNTALYISSDEFGDIILHGEEYESSNDIIIDSSVTEIKANLVALKKYLDNNDINFIHKYNNYNIPTISHEDIYTVYFPAFILEDGLYEEDFLEDNKDSEEIIDAAEELLYHYLNNQDSNRDLPDANTLRTTAERILRDNPKVLVVKRFPYDMDNSCRIVIDVKKFLKNSPL